MNIHAYRARFAGAWRCVAVLAVASALTSNARAGNDFVLMSGQPTTVPLPGGGSKVIPPSPGSSPSATRVWLGRITDGAVKVDDVIKIGGKAGEMPVKVRQAVKIADAGAAVGRCVRNPVCAAAAVGVGAYLLSKYLTRPNADGELERDAGQNPNDVLGYTCSMSMGGFTDTHFAATPVDACIPLFNIAMSRVYAGYSIQIGFDCPTSSGTNCVAKLKSNTNADTFWIQFPYKRETRKLCPPVVDFYDPAYSVPGGPAGNDGKCPTGVYTERMTPDQIGQRIATYPPAVDDETLPATVRKAIEAGEVAPSTVSTEGPATQVGTPVKTTTTDATGTKTTTSTPTYNYHYDGDTITYSTSISTVTVNNDGSSSTSTTTTEGTKPEDKDDPCVKAPNRVGCMELGSPPGDRIPTKVRDMSFASESLGLPSACPAPVVLPRGEKISYQTLCDGLTQTRPLIIAIGFLMAGGIVVAALRR